MFIFEEAAFTTVTLSELFTLSCCAVAAWAGYELFDLNINANTLAEEEEKEDEKKKKKPIVFPENPDDFMPEFERKGKRGHIHPEKDVRVRPEKHPLKPGEKYNPRHHGQHYHVDVKDPTKEWETFMDEKDYRKCKPPGYKKGDGTGFLPGESYPDIPKDYRVLNGK